MDSLQNGNVDKFVEPYPRTEANGEPAKVIAITGGAGFIGSHLSDKLLRQGHTVICIDNFHTGRRRNILDLFDSGRFQLFTHDVTEPLSNRLPRFDQIYNLACPASPVHYQADRVRTAMVFVKGAMNVL